MSPKKPPDSTRARKARSAKPSPKPRRKPILSPADMAKRLETRKSTTGLYTSTADIIREARGPIGTVAPELTETALKDIRRRLELIHDVIITVAIALQNEAAEHDLDFANVLTRSAADPLWAIIVERLGGDDEEDQ